MGSELVETEKGKDLWGVEGRSMKLSAQCTAGEKRVNFATDYS